jgi:glycosyltransferase involved in cell wall biosynthesis
MKVLGILAGNNQSEFLRIKLPFTALHEQRGEMWNWTQTIRPDHLMMMDRYDVIVMERAVTKYAQWLESVRWYAMHSGKTIIVDVDDDFTCIPPWNPAYESITPEVIQATEDLYRLANGVTTSTEYLGRKMSRYNKNVFVLPNALDLELWEKVHEIVPLPDGITIGWFGSQSHVRDMEILEEAWPQVAERCPEVQFICSGFTSEKLRGLMGKRMTIYGWAPLQHYPAMVRQIRIGCLPLQDVEFNRSKSNLKWMEFGSLGIPCVASDFGPYASLRGEVDVLFASTTAQWVTQLVRLIRSSEVRKRIGTAARREVLRNHNVREQAERWSQVYETIRKRQDVDDPALALRPLGRWL